MGRKRWFERDSVRAVHEYDLAEYLVGLGVYEIVESGQARCRYCGSAIGMENLGALFPDGEAVSYVCDNLLCLNSVLGEGGE